MLMTAADYRDSLRRYQPRVFVDGKAVASVADEPLLAPGVAAVGVTYDLAHGPEHAPLMTARQATSGKTVNRMLHVDETSADLLAKLEAVRLVCKISGCAQRYLAHDALAALFQATKRPTTPTPPSTTSASSPTCTRFRTGTWPWASP
mgnify:CR=1 FL=1